MCPHSAHLRRCNHHPPRAKHSTQPVPLGLAAGVDTVSLGFHRLLSDFCLLPLLLIDGRTKGALFDTLALPRPRRPRRPMRSPPREPHVAEVYVITRDTCGHHRCFHVSCRLAVSKVRLALPNFYNIAIRIANVAARLAVYLSFGSVINLAPRLRHSS